MPVSTSTVRVRYAETDQMGVVYHANYLVWFEVARTDLLRSLGATYRDLEEEDGVRLPVIEVECRYRRPARYDDVLEIRAEGRLLSPVRVEFTYSVTRAGSDEVVATGASRHAAMARDGRPCRLPARVRDLLQ
jgi:acyl-CoA thioester hydrolase